MDTTFEKNYWSLYLNFLRDFKDLTYRGFSIPYFCIYPKLVNRTKKRWNHLLFNKNLTRNLKYQVNDLKEIQDEFNQMIKVHQKVPLIKNKQGKVVLHVDNALRFPKETFIDHFNPSKTLLLGVLTNSNASRTNKKRMQPRVKMSNTISISSNPNKQKQQSKATTTQQNPSVIEKLGITHLPIDYLQNYSKNLDHVIIQKQKEAQEIINSNQHHPLYGDLYFQRTLLKQIADIINRIEEVYNFLKKVSISCIVISNPHYINRILAFAAAENGIPTICMQHGIVGKSYTPKIATIDAVYGKFERRWYMNLGIPKNALEMIGHPKFDQLLTRKKLSKSEFYKRFGLDTRKKTLLVTVRETYDLEEWRIFIKTLSDKYSLNILIRDYPGRETNTLSKEFPFVHSTDNYHLYDILPNVDAVVSYPSTVGLEAMLANKPAFILVKKFTDEIYERYKNDGLYVNKSLVCSPHYSNYYNRLSKMAQKDPKKLAEAVIEYFTNPEWEEYAKIKRERFLQYAYPNLLSSGVRLKNLIHKLTR